jgi:hypothetical protein
MLYIMDIWLEIVETIWNIWKSSNFLSSIFGCAQVKIFMRKLYTKPQN